MHYISSVSNDQVKHMVNLQHKSYRQEHGQFVIEGTRSTLSIQLHVELFIVNQNNLVILLFENRQNCLSISIY